ncbi:MAG: hypothetical protein GY861_02930 [bacterium]|nr:hypothetical protein [bacterium]
MSKKKDSMEEMIKKEREDVRKTISELAGKTISDFDYKSDGRTLEIEVIFFTDGSSMSLSGSCERCYLDKWNSA